MLPWVIDMTGMASATIAIFFGLLMCIPAYKLYKTLNTKFAVQLMFGSFLYLPLMLIVYLIDKI
jgi:protoheme IX farnesyltransferase